MLHKCAAAVNGCKKQASDLCKHGYSRTQPEPETWLDNRGYWHYRRRTQQDMHVVPSNDFTSMDWGGHVNVEYSGTVERVLYLFKYLYKGVKKQSVTISNRNQQEPLQRDDNEEENEIQMCLKARVLCSMDAVWRTFGFHTYPKPFPAVKTIKVKLPSDIDYLLAKGLLCDLYIYLHRPLPLRHLKYTEFFCAYTVKKTLTALQQCSIVEDRFEIDLLGVTYYYCPRPAGMVNQRLTRMEMVYINHGEVYYLRVILLKRPVISFEDARRDAANNVMYPK